MNIKHRPLTLGLALGSWLMLLQTALPTHAQDGNGSDVTGAIVTTSDIGGFFAPQSGTEGGSQTAFASNAVAVAVNTAAASINTQLNSAAVPGGEPFTPGGAALGAEEIQILLDVLTASGTASTDTASGLSANVQSLIGALTVGVPSGSPSANLVSNLVAALTGLTANGTVSPAKLSQAVEAFNAVINASGQQYLNNPPAQVLAIRGILSSLVNAGANAAKN